VSLQLLLGLALVPPVWARTVSIQAAVPLPDSSDAEFRRALHSAVETCVRGAVAMGMSWIRLQHAAIVERQLVVVMIGSDETDASEDGHDGGQSHEGIEGHDGGEGHDGVQGHDGDHGHNGDQGGDAEVPQTLM